MLPLAMCVVSRLDGCTDAQKTDSKPYLSMPITRLRSQVARSKWTWLLYAESWHEPNQSTNLRHGRAVSWKRNEANVKAAHLRKQVDAAQGHVMPSRTILVKAIAWQSVLLFRSHEQHVLGSGWVPRSTTWGKPQQPQQ